jgi:HIRAN domain
VSEGRLRIWLERGELGGGRGFWLRDAASRDALGWQDERLAAAGVRVLPVVGTSSRGDALQDDAFAPGNDVTLVAEPDNEHDPNAVAVWDAARRLHAGYVPAEIAAELVLPLKALSLWEWREGDRRVGLRIIVAPAAVWLGRPRPRRPDSGA